MNAHRTLIRRLCFALVAARTLAFAIAPFIESRALDADLVSAAVHTTPDTDHTPAPPQHDPATCAVCVLLHDAPWTPSAAPAVDLAADATHRAFVFESVSIPAAPRQGFLSRAPPAPT